MKILGAWASTRLQGVGKQEFCPSHLRRFLSLNVVLNLERLLNLRGCQTVSGHRGRAVDLETVVNFMFWTACSHLLIAIAYWRAGLFIVVYSDSVTFPASIYFYFPIFETMFNMLNNLFNSGGCYNLSFTREWRANRFPFSRRRLQ